MTESSFSWRPLDAEWNKDDNGPGERWGASLTSIAHNKVFPHLTSTFAAVHQMSRTGVSVLPSAPHHRSWFIPLSSTSASRTAIPCI